MLQTFILGWDLSGHVSSFVQILLPCILLLAMFSTLSTVPYSKWNDHVLGWWKHREDPNVLFLRYEEMQKVCDYFIQI